MGQKDIGTCVLLTHQDLEKLGVNLIKLNHLRDGKTPYERSFFRSKTLRKLREHIHSDARNVSLDMRADVALITSQDDWFGLRDSIRYHYSLYKYY
jgi:hypothetical protein